MAAFGWPFFLNRINTPLKEREMIDMILSGVVSLAIGYIIPQPKWAQTLQVLLWEWITNKLKKVFTK